MAISNVPWFATTVEGPFDVGAGGIFATIVRVVQAFVCVWVIIKVNIKFILPEQTGSQYSHQQYNIIIYYIRVPNGLGLQGSGLKTAGLRDSAPKWTGLQGSREIDQGLQALLYFFALIQTQILELRKYSNFYFLNAVFISFSPLYSCFTVI